jgi:hypothetical protein
MEYDYSIFDQFDTPKETSDDDDAVCCGVARVNIEELSYAICTECGSCVFSQTYVGAYVPNGRMRKRSIYKPISHMRHKLQEICGHLIPPNELNWGVLFKDVTIKSVRDVRALLKKMKQTSLNKYCYYFYYKLTGKHVITLSANVRSALICNFVKIHASFRKIRDGTRKNLPNFHYIIHRLLLREGIDVKNKLFIPIKNTRRKNMIIWKQIEVL